MRKFSVMLVAGIVLVGDAAWAGPFVDSVIVASKAFALGSQGIIEVYIHNDSALNGIALPIVIKSQSGGAFATVNRGGGVDSIQMVVAHPGAPIYNLTRINGTDPDSLFILWIDLSGGTIAAGTRREAFRIFVTNNSNAGVYVLDSNRLNASQTLKFTHPPTQSSVPKYILGRDTVGLTAVREEHNSSLPTSFALSQNRPNPFNPTTTITFALPKESEVTLEVFNLLGQKVIDLVDEHLSAGTKSVEWDGRDALGREVPSGIYFYRMRAESFAETKKMVLMK